MAGCTAASISIRRRSSAASSAPCCCQAAWSCEGLTVRSAARWSRCRWNSLSSEPTDCRAAAILGLSAVACGSSGVVTDPTSLSALASALHARATIGTIRAQFTNVPARLAPPPARSGCTCRPTGPVHQPAPDCSTKPSHPRNRLNPSTAARPNPIPEVEERDRPADHPRPTCDQDHLRPSGPLKNRGDGSRFNKHLRWS